MGTIANIRTGKPHVTPDKPAHTSGVREGNKQGAFNKEPGLYMDGTVGKATARRSTGINPQDRNPIDPRSPNLPPA